MAYDNTKDLFLDTGTKQTSKTYTAKSQKTVIDDIIGPSDTEHRVVSGDIRGADKSTIKGGNDTIDASTEYLKNATITGDAMVVSGSKLTGGNDRITVLRITHGDANILGDAKSVSNSTVTGGKDTIIVSGSITGTASNKALISGDLETFSGTNKTFTAGSDIITLRGSSSHVEIYGDVKTITGTGNKLLGGHDVVTLGTTTFGESRVVSDSLIDLGQGNDTLVAYSKLQSTSINGGSGNDTITVNSLENMKSILGGLGDDYITVNETINTGTISQISGGGGTNDTLELGKAITTTFSMGANLLNSGVKVVDFEKYVFAEVGSGGTLNGTSAAENISIKQLSSGKAYTLGGGDTVFVGQASGTALVDGGYGADKITVNNLYGSAAVLGGFGADVISIKNLHSGSVYTNNTANADDAARDTITVTTMKAGTVHGDMGNDLITVDDMQSGKISANGGNDVINVSYKANTGAARSIDGGGANDTINISNSAGSMELLGGAGADTFTITKSAGNITLGDIDTAVDSVFVDGVNYTTDIKNAQEGGQTSITVGDLTMHFDKISQSIVIAEKITGERIFENIGSTPETLYLDGAVADTGLVLLNGLGGFVVTTSDGKGVFLEAGDGTGGGIYGSEGVDTINISSSTRTNVVSGNGGNDIITVNMDDGGFDAKFFGGAGADKINITINSPGGAIADGGDGDDIITITGTTQYADLGSSTGGAGNDTLNLTFTNPTYTGSGQGYGYNITGGAGADRFNISQESSGGINLYDFDAAQGDTLFVGATNYTDAMQNAQARGDEFITAGDVTVFLDQTAYSKTTTVQEQVVSNDHKYTYTNADTELEILKLDGGIGTNGVVTALSTNNAGFKITSTSGAFTMQGGLLHGSTSADTFHADFVNGTINAGNGSEESGMSDDTILVNQLGSSGTINADGGNDAIVVNTLVGGDIYGNAGNDTITVQSVEHGYINGGAGNDTINIVQAITGNVEFDDDVSGEDVFFDNIQLQGGIATGALVTISAPMNLIATKMTGGKIQTVNEALTDININVQHMSGGEIAGSTNDCTIEIGTMVGGKIFTGTGQDTISIGDAKNVTIENFGLLEFGNSVDTVFLRGGLKAGDKVVLITTGDVGFNVYGGEIGLEPIKHFGFSMEGGTITAGLADDHIIAMNMSGDSVINGGDGRDSISVGMDPEVVPGNIWDINFTSGTVNGGAGNDTITVGIDNTTTADAKVTGGEGADTFNIHGSQGSSITITDFDATDAIQIFNANTAVYDDVTADARSAQESGTSYVYNSDITIHFG